MTSLIKVSSAARSTGTPSSFTIHLTNKLHGRYRLAQAYVPNTAYNITASTATLGFYEDAADKSCSITPGYYTATNIAPAIKAALDAASGGYNTFTVTVSTITGKMTIAAGNAFSIVYSTSTIADLLGFTADSATATSVTADYALALQGDLSFNILINSQSSIINAAGNGFTYMIPHGPESLGSWTMYEPIDWVQTTEFESPCNTLRIRVVDDQGNDQEIQHDWYIVLRSCE